jgi:hypothetical protein
VLRHAAARAAREDLRVWTARVAPEPRRGGMDRVLASPVWRGALNVGSVVQAVITIVIQTAVIVLLALALGADYANGIGGVLILIVVAALLGAAFASLSNGLAVLARQRETLIGAVTLVVLPLTFLSSALMQQDLVPGWIHTVAKFNPVNWAVEGGPLRRHAVDRLGTRRQPGRLAPRPGAALGDLRHPGLCYVSALVVRGDGADRTGLARVAATRA